MPTHAREGLNRILLGSVAERLTRLSMIPVILMRLERQCLSNLTLARVVPLENAVDLNGTDAFWSSAAL